MPVLIPVMSSLQPTPGKLESMKCCPPMLKEEPPPVAFTLCRDIWLLPVRLEQIENRSTTRNECYQHHLFGRTGTDFRTLDLNKTSLLARQ